MALNVANVELTDSFNTWRLRTNEVIAEAASANDITTFVANTTFDAPTTFNANTTFNAGIVSNYLNVTGDIDGTLSTAAQPNITSVGTLTSLTLSGALSGVTTIDASGEITASDFNSTSDLSLKKDIKKIENPIEIVKLLEGKFFNWKGSNKPSLGFIAQEVEIVLPEVINTNENNLKTVNYSVIVALLVEAIKQQQEQIDQLKQS